MLQEILEAIQCRTEEVKFLGEDYIVREVDVSKNLKLDEEVEKQGAEQGADRADMLYWSVVVSAIFRKEDGLPLFTPADIPVLRKASRSKMTQLLAAVDRVNGFSADDNAKK